MLTQLEAQQAVAEIMKRERPLLVDAVVRPRSSADTRYAVGWYRLSRHSRWHAYGSTWEEAIERLKVAMPAKVNVDSAGGPRRELPFTVVVDFTMKGGYQQVAW